MMRRIWLAGFVLPSLACVVMRDSAAQQPTYAEYSEKLNALQQERLDALSKRYDAIKGRYDSGRVTFDYMSTALDELLHAKADMATSKKDRVEICRQRIDNLRGLEEHRIRQAKAGTVQVEEMYAAVAARCLVEIECLRLELQAD